MQSSKKVPTRTCLGCRETFPKKELIRIVRKPDGEVAIDDKGKMNGRGAYLCRNKGCLEKAFKRDSIGRALEAKISVEIYEKLLKELEDIEA